jgi:hypothetical protein
MNQEEMQAFVATVTPERVRQMVLDLEPQQPKASRGTVPLYEMLEVLSQAVPSIQVGEQALLDALLRPVIMAAANQIEGMSFVEGDG